MAGKIAIRRPSCNVEPKTAAAIRSHSAIFSESFGRTFFNGNRDATNSNVLFTENRDRFYGPVFTLTISGTI